MALVPFSYINIHEYEKKDNNEKSDNKIHNFYVDDKLIKIKEFREKGIGGIFWECVRIFIKFFNLNCSP